MTGSARALLLCAGASALAGVWTGAQAHEDVDEIVVTATRRAESIQDVPIAVTAVQGDLVENAGIEDVRGIEQLAPSLQATSGQSAATGTSLIIRGVGTGGDNPGFEPAVGVFIDGVYRPRAGVALAELPPLERVEVLRGPQGTLFGRNTSGGAISVITQGPEFEPGGFIEGVYGNYDETEVRGMLTGPVSETVALRLDANWRVRDGYVEDLNSDRAFNDIDRSSVRGQLAYETDALRVRAIADYYETDEQCCAGINFDPGGTGPIVDALAAQQGLVGIADRDPEDRVVAYSPNRDLAEEVEEWGGSVEAVYDVDGMTLTSVTAYRDWAVTRNQDVDFSGIDRAYREGYRTGISYFTQEVRLQGEALDGRLDWLVGGFYLDERLDLTDTVRFGAQADAYVDALFALNPDARFEFFDSFGPDVPEFGQVLLATNPELAAAAQVVPGLFDLLNTPLPGVSEGQGQQADEFEVRTRSFAPFTHNIVRVTDALDLTLGLRWNYEEKDLTADLFAINPASEFFLNPQTAFYTDLIAQNVPDAILLSSNPAVNSEFNGRYRGDRNESELTGTVKIAYDVTGDVLLYGGYDRGFKSGGFNLDRGSFDTVLLGGDGPQVEDLEFEEETVDAFEVGAKTRFGPGIVFNVALFYQMFQDYQELIFSGSNFVVNSVDEYDTYGVEIDGSWSPVDSLDLRYGYAVSEAEREDPDAVVVADEDGEDALTHRVTGSATWMPRLSDRFDGLAHIDMRYVSRNSLDDAPVLIETGDFLIANARLGVQTTDDRVQVEVYVDNLFDTYYNLATFGVPEQQASAVYPNLPRLYGVRARVGF